MFIDNKYLLEEIKQSSQNPTEGLTNHLMAIADGLSKSKHFRGYSHLREDLYAEILTSLLMNYRKFDPRISENPFGYLTTIGINAGRAYSKKDKQLEDFRNTMVKLARGE